MSLREGANMEYTQGYGSLVIRFDKNGNSYYDDILVTQDLDWVGWFFYNISWLAKLTCCYSLMLYLFWSLYL